MAEITVRRAAPEDASEVAQLLHDFNREFDAFTPGVAVLTDRVRELLADGKLIVLLGGSGPDGLAQLSFRSSVFYGGLDALLEELYVAPERRGEGIGRALLEAALEAAREAGAGRIELGTSDDDTTAIALYESTGFTDRETGPDGPRMRFYERDL